MIFDLQWLSAQASMQVLIISASLYVLLNQLNGDKGALFLPEARRVCLFNCYRYARRLLTSSISQNHTEAKIWAVWVPLKAMLSVMHYYYN